MSKKLKISNQQTPETLNYKESTTTEDIIYSALGSQIRRDIIIFIHTNEKVGFLDLKAKFDMKVGSLYHQLNMMKEIWHQDENKKYSLTDLGKVAYNLILVNKDQIEISNVKLQSSSDEIKRISFFKHLYDGLIFFFLPKKIFQYLTQEALRTFFEGLIIIGGLLFFSIDSGIVLIGFYPLMVDYWYYSILGVLGLWLFLGLSIDLMKVIFYKRKFNPLKLFTVIPFTLLANLIVMFFIWLQTKVTTIFLFTEGTLLIILSQIWALALTTTAVSHSEELTINRSSLIVLFSFYLLYGISFVLFGVLG
ncbi:MAG: hypothetical protein JXA54_13565 [Candidatus Heimdallarchaeota archaeon]|nr:hypothetical protein [Candidatus Heimdallarchaeota archaeon]